MRSHTVNKLNFSFLQEASVVIQDVSLSSGMVHVTVYHLSNRAAMPFPSASNYEVDYHK
jgi:hypothetical protein